MAIYTKTGDQGETGLLGGKRILKSDIMIEAFGAVDELNALLGVIRSSGIQKKEDRLLERIQNNLFELCVSDTKFSRLSQLSVRETAFLEKQIDEYERRLTPLRNFIQPGGAKTASLFHLARTVCRRAERKFVASKNRKAIPYLNRLSDLLFVLARHENARLRKKEKIWKRAA